ncbi:hypothetical protein DFH07DRAFT_541870 [Mycena maculata]|uniref:Uncharacterized protein n=1 Tax=Mycena maculata TaxID=230809 RepID=A0AAD7IUU4_9AGAR|nr:hypothetical protein DFH07DRAFT_541870 [Mycena maculata]
MGTAMSSSGSAGSPTFSSMLDSPIIFDAEAGFSSVGTQGYLQARREDPIPPCPPNAAGWFSKVYSEVTQKNLGAAFNALLSVFLELEGVYGWLNCGGKGLGTLHRPPQVAAWVTAGRGRGGAMGNGVGPAIPSLAEFEDLWWKWWGELQPDWRVSDPQPGRLKRDMWPAGGLENWQTLRHPGPNGALSLIATLCWWGIKAKS